MYVTEVVKMYLNDCVVFFKNFNRKQTECSYILMLKDVLQIFEKSDIYCYFGPMIFNR